MNIVPVLLIKNEENWIRSVVHSLLSVFPHVIVSDTGSTDNTIDRVKSAGFQERLDLYEKGPLPPHQLGECRQWMQEVAKEKFGATHIFLVDGDELYPKKYLRFIQDFPMPENALSGFTWGKEIRQLDNGELCFLSLNGEDVGLSRQAIISVDSKWSGVYPFESPSTYDPGNPLNYYWKSPDDTYHFFHLHQTVRSSRDADVYIRMQKQKQFGMQDNHSVLPARPWLSSREEYSDE